MQKYGFTALKEEWWHYDFKDWKRYDVCNLSFGQIDSVNAGIK
jgi:D-alanyl-D-alanine dipeptidase